MKPLVAFASLAWSAAAVAHALPASALLLASGYVGQNPYASCSANYEAIVLEGPICHINIYPNYIQTIRLISSPCNSGSCEAEGVTYVTAPYSPGRKPANYVPYCGDGLALYEVGDCAC